MTNYILISSDLHTSDNIHNIYNMSGIHICQKRNSYDHYSWSYTHILNVTRFSDFQILNFQIPDFQIPRFQIFRFSEIQIFRFSNFARMEWQYWSDGGIKNQTFLVMRKSYVKISKNMKIEEIWKSKNQNFRYNIHRILYRKSI